MTPAGTLHPGAVAGTVTDCTLVWIDAREAAVVRWHDGEVRLERLRSDVPAHHRGTGHVRHDPAVRHGGGMAQDAAEANRLEHLARFIDTVATHVPADGELLIIGPGPVRDRLGHRIRETDRRTAGAREVSVQTAGRLTEPQLVARLRQLAGAEPRRRTLGAHRWAATPSGRATGTTRRTSRRAIPSPPIDIDDED